MRVETSVLLPEELLAAIDRNGSDRSSFLERAARWYLDFAVQDHGARDLEIINANADSLNEEAADVLDYQKYLD